MEKPKMLNVLVSNDMQKRALTIDQKLGFNLRMQKAIEDFSIKDMATYLTIQFFLLVSNWISKKIRDTSRIIIISNRIKSYHFCGSVSF